MISHGTCVQIVGLPGEVQMARRRGNNEGSIYQLPNGKWRAQISLNGHRFSHVFKTRQECQDWKKKTINQIDGGLSYVGASMKLGDFIEVWMKTVNENRRPKTHIQ